VPNTSARREAARGVAPLLTVGLVLALLAASCGDDDTTAAPTTTASPTTTPAATDTTAAPTTGTAPATTPAATGALPTLVLSGQGNDLAAYDAQSGAHRFLIESAKDDPVNGRDVNGQICFFPDDPDRFIAGEDTGQPDAPAGWGAFELSGATFDELTARQIAKLTPTYQAGPQPENYGCGFLPDGRLLTTDIGFQASGPENGQLIVWFPPFEGAVSSYCKVDVEVGTALGIAVVDGAALVASSRGETAGVLRYEGDWPTGPTATGGCGRTDDTGAPLVDEGRIRRATFITPGEGLVAAGLEAQYDKGLARGCTSPRATAGSG
jgi:hypothetical protein